jgi:probable rRNA maturation factor
MRDGPPLEGDLALCAPVVTREARSQRKHLTAHYAHLTVHGILHLQGYEHDTEADAAEMEKLESRILRRLGYPNPYATPPHHG